MDADDLSADTGLSGSDASGAVVGAALRRLRELLRPLGFAARPLSVLLAGRTVDRRPRG